jgi:hypothetical protein
MVLTTEYHIGRSCSSSKYYILYKQDKKIKMHPMECFQMVRKVDAEPEQNENLYEKLAHKEKKQLLVDAFGTKKS